MALPASDRHLEVPPYEEMALYYPQANQRRPLILVGPPSIGRHELRLQLLEDTARFAAAVPRKSLLHGPDRMVFFILLVLTGLTLCMV